MPINLSGSAVEQFKPEVLHSEILYKLMDDDNQKAEVIAEMLGALHEQSGGLLIMEKCCKFVQDAVAGIFVSANYNKAKEFVYGYDSRHYAGTVISLLRRYLSTRPIMHVLSNLRLARSIRELEAQSLEKNDESG